MPSPLYRVSVPRTPPIQPIPIDPISPHLFSVLFKRFSPYFLLRIVAYLVCDIPWSWSIERTKARMGVMTLAHPPLASFPLHDTYDSLLSHQTSSFCILTAFFNGLTVSFSLSLIFSSPSLSQVHFLSLLSSFEETDYPPRFASS